MKKKHWNRPCKPIVDKESLVNVEHELELDDDLIEQALSLAPEGITLDSLVEMSLKTWIDIRRQQATNADSSPE